MGTVVECFFKGLNHPCGTMKLDKERSPYIPIAHMVDGMLIIVIPNKKSYDPVKPPSLEFEERGWKDCTKHTRKISTTSCS